MSIGLLGGMFSYVEAKHMCLCVCVLCGMYDSTVQIVFAKHAEFTAPHYTDPMGLQEGLTLQDQSHILLTESKSSCGTLGRLDGKG